MGRDITGIGVGTGETVLGLLHKLYIIKSTALKVNTLHGPNNRAMHAYYTTGTLE